MKSNPTSVLTVPQSATTLKTSAIVTATAVDSTIPQRIDSFIKQKLSEANSDDASGIIDSAKRAARLGFANSANARYSVYLEAFRSSPHLSATYEESYPNSVFLPWKAMHQVMKSLDLRMDLPEFYLGAVPPEQLPWMEIFELSNDHEPAVWDVHDMIPQVDRTARLRLEIVLSHFMERDDMPHERFDASTFTGRDAWQREIILRGRMAGPAARFWREARSSFFVVAPPDAFATDKDWLTRLSTLTREFDLQVKAPPNDPLVVRMCHGGCLVVAAWGDEAAELNEITKALKL